MQAHIQRQEHGEQLMVVAILGSDLTYNELSQIVTDTRWTDAETIFAGIDGSK